MLVTETLRLGGYCLAGHPHSCTDSTEVVFSDIHVEERMLGTACCSQQVISSNKSEEDELVFGGWALLQELLRTLKCPFKEHFVGCTQ